MLYLRIENPGVCPPEGFTLFGATTKRRTSNPLVIGTFGSGNKHATCLLLRGGYNPTIFCGSLGMNFGTRQRRIVGVSNTVESRQVIVRYRGKDQEGRSRSAEEELSVTLDYGTADWPTVSLALREYVSNALDACFEQGMSVEQARKAVKIEVVDENQVRAKADHTRVFVPLLPDVQRFYDDLGKWFLHFSNPELVTQAILPKGGRNVTDGKQVAVIYRRGVFVREFLSTDKPSLYDYNLNDLRLNESRTASDWDVKHACGQAIAGADRVTLARVFRAMRDPGADFWEFTFDSYGLSNEYIPDEEKTKREETWQAAFEAVAGADAVLMDDSHPDIAGMVSRKGYTPVTTGATAWVDAAKKHGIRSDEKVLTADDLEGRTFSDATDDVRAVLDWVWNLVEIFDMANGKSKPAVGCFYRHMVAGSDNRGLYRDGTVYVHTDLAHGKSEALRWTVWHEVGHHVTGATDGSYDFVVWFNRLVAKMGNQLLKLE